MIMTYKGFYANPVFSKPDNIFYGRILNTDDFVDFMTEDSSQLENEFHSAVDDYLNLCSEIGKNLF